MDTDATRRFHRFRPTSHFIAPHSWSNDPCGAVFVPETQEYLVCYQWNPGTTVGGNCAWGMARSRDLLTWEDCPPALWNGETYDRLGVFSGSIVARRVEGRTVLHLFYTSVSHMPIHWSRAYTVSCESQSVAVSTDFGRTWQRSASNPLLSKPPRGALATGWRDPFVSTWASLSNLLGRNHETHYMLVSGGERGRGPQLSLYASEDDNLEQWQVLSLLLDVEPATPISPGSPFNWGVNFECASFFTLGTTDYIIVGVEEAEGSTRHNGHYLLWLSGYLVLENKRMRFNVTSHGTLDAGLLYAAHIFRDAEGRLLQLGWADETAKQQVVRSQGWAGCLGHPRELFCLKKPVPAAGHRPLSAQWTVDEAGQMTTLGIRPAPQVELLRESSRVISSLDTFSSLQSTNFEVEATFPSSCLTGTEKLVLNVRASPDFEEVTQIVVDLENYQISIDKSKSSLARLDNSKLSRDTGRFDLLPDEDLHIRLFVDESVVEVFANDRFAMTSRVYSSLATSTRVSYDFGTLDESCVSCQCWDRLKSAWPGRDAGNHLLDDMNPLRAAPHLNL